MTPQPCNDTALLAASRHAVGRYGVQGATLERIAEAAGVSRTTLHRRGVTRDLVLQRLGEEAAEAYRRALWPALTSPGSGRERLQTALNALCEAPRPTSNCCSPSEARPTPSSTPATRTSA